MLFSIWASSKRKAAAKQTISHGDKEPDEIQQGKVQGPAPGEEQPHVQAQAWGRPAVEQLCGEGPGCPGGWQGDREPTVCPGYQEGQWDPGVH